MALDININYRIKRNADQEDAMRYLANELKVFKDYAHILLASAIVGYNNGLYVEIENYASDAVQLTFFTERERDLIDFIAYAHKKEQAVLNSEEKFTIFESYANGGFDLLLNRLGVNMDDKSKNDRILILKKVYQLLLLGVN